MTLPYNCHLKYSSRADWRDERLDAPTDWLGCAELAELVRLRDVSRRQQWLAGRRISKQLVCETYGTAINDVQILTRDQRQRGVKPLIFVDGQLVEWSLSLSHSEAGVLVVLADTNELTVGVDLVGEVPGNAGFRRLWFTQGEQLWMLRDTERRTSFLWGLKEAVYKACNTGESWMPQAIELLPQADGSFDCLYRGYRLRELQITTWNVDQQLAVLVSLPRHELQTLTSSAKKKPFSVSSRTFCNSTPASNQEVIALCS